MTNMTRYVLSNKRIARGGMAEIFLGKSIDANGNEEICAIKRILPHFAGEREYLEMFRSEAGICKRLVHPNIVRVYDFRNVDGNYALVMEFVNGTDLRTLLAACEKSRVRLSVPMCIHLATHVARGLHYAHTKLDDVTGQPMGIVHRDISPQNILVSYEGEVKIIDFGIANFEAKNLETKPGVVKGKYSYMSPEQVVARRLDARSDVFSLSIILWEALSMKRLFAAETEVETIANVQNCLIKHNLKDLNRNVDDDLMRIIAKGLEKDRRYRYATAQAMENDLQQYVQSKYPDFKHADLGEFLKQILALKRIEIQQDIKKLMANKPLPKSGETVDENQTKVKVIPAWSKKPPPPTAADKKAYMSNFSGSAAPKLTPPPIEAAAVNVHSQPSLRKHSGSPRRKNASAKRKAYMQRLMHFRNLHMRQRKHQKSNLLTIVAGLFILFCVVIGFNQWRNKAGRTSMQLLIKATPARVALNLNGKPLFAGTYIRTPIKMALPAGSHKVLVTRQGYETVTLKFKGSEGDLIKEEDLRLTPSKQAVFASVRIEDSAAKNIYVDVDKGLYTGKTPLQVKDLDMGVSHAVVVYPHYPKKTNAFKCSFELKMKNADKALRFTIFRAEGKRLAKCSLGD